MNDFQRANDESIDSLRMSDRELLALLAQMDSRTKKTEEDSRSEPRSTLRVNTRVPIVLEYPSGQIVTHLVVTRNISRTGLAFLDGMFCYPGSPCRVVLTTTNGERLEVPGRVIRCGLVGGRVHEAAVLFDEPIDPAQFLLKNVA
jgi:hypothetical protein